MVEQQGGTDGCDVGVAAIREIEIRVGDTDRTGGLFNGQAVPCSGAAGSSRKADVS